MLPFAWLRKALAAGPLIAIVASGAFQQPIVLAASGTLYVDKNAVNCSNAGTGTTSQPYCSIGAAASAATAGMTVYVNTGMYYETVNAVHSGVQDGPITFQPNPGSSVTISGQLHGFTVSRQSWVIIAGFNIIGTSSYGILLSSSTQITVHGNQVSYAGLPIAGQTAQGIYLTGTTNSLIENNTVGHNTGAGIGLYAGSTGVEVRHNLVFSNAQQFQRNAQGIDVQSASATVDYNITHDNEDSGIQFYPGGNNGVAYGNVTYNNGDHGIDNLDVTGGVLVGNSAFHNCTSGINVEGTSANYTIENNIAVDNAVYPAYKGISCTRRTGNIGVYDSAPATTTANYNMVNLTTAGDLYNWNETAYSSLAALQAASGQESHGIQADPKWANAAAGDFHLTAASPGVDSANSSAPHEPSVDIDGNARVDDLGIPNTGNGPSLVDDRGAYEFQPPATAATCQTSGLSGGSYTVTVCITSPGNSWVVSGSVPISFTVNVTGTGSSLNEPVLFLDAQYFTQSFTTATPFNKFSIPSTKYVDGTHVLSLEADMQDGFKSAWASVTLDFSNGVRTPPINTGTFVPVSGAMPPSGQYLIGAVGDGANGTSDADSVATTIYNWNPNLFLYLGDVYQNASVGDFYNLYGTGNHYGMLRSITNPTIGNHEYQTGSPSPYFDYWNNVPHYYSFNVAGWHFISLDSTSEFNQYSPGTPQYTWLVNDLKANTSPCTVVYYHRPVFGSSWTGGAPELMPIWNLLAQYGVKLVLNGHEHDYQRWVPLDGNGSPSPTGVTEIVAGMGGNGVDSIARSDSRVAFADGTGGDYGALRITLTATGLSYQFVLTTGGTPDSGSISCSVNDTQPPTVPNAPAATAPSQNQVNLTWTASTDNVGVAGYTVYRNVVKVGTVTTPGYTDNGVVASTTYTYTVDAFDADGNHSVQSVGTSVTTPAADTQPPTMPAGLSAAGANATTVNLGWTASTDDAGVAGYTIYRNGLPVATSNATTYTDTGLTPSTAYVYTVDAFDAAGNHSEQSAPAGATTAAKPITFVQGATKGTGGRLTSTTITLTKAVIAGDLLTGLFGQWDAAGQASVSDNVNGPWTRVQGMPYNSGKGNIAIYYVANSKAAAGGLTITITASAATYLTGTVGEYSGIATLSPVDQVAMHAGSGTVLDSGATVPVGAGELVFGALTANNNPGSVTPGTSQGLPFFMRSAFGDSASGDILSSGAGTQDARFTATNSGPWYAFAVVFKPAATDASPPSTPTVVSASPTGTSITVSWTASSDDVGVDGYSVYRNGSLLTTVGGPTLAYVDGSVGSVATYTYTIDAFDAAGNHSAMSAPATVTTPDWVPPAVPGGVSATAVSQTQVSIGWNASTDNVGVAGYDVFRDGALLATVGASTSGYSDSTVSASTTHSYTVDAFDLAGNHSVASAPASVTTPAPPDTTPPASPPGVAATATSPTSVVVSWSASSDDVGVTGYDLYRDGASVGTVGRSTLQYTDTVASGSTHSYTVDAFDAAGNVSAQSAPPVSVTTPTSDTTPPSVPSGVTASASGPAAVLVTWTASTDNVGVAGYDVFRNGIILSTLSSTTLSLTDSGVTPGGNYSYTVDAFDAQGNHSAASSPAAVHVPAQIKFVQGKVATTGSRVTSMTLSLGAVAAGDLLVGWFAQYDAAGQVNVTDNLNGLWTRSSAATTWKGTAGDIALYYLANVSAAPSLTINVSAAAATYLQASVSEYSGVAASGPLDQISVNKGTSTTADSGLTGAIGAGELAYGAVVASSGPGTLAPGSTQGVNYVARAQSSSGSQGEEDVLSSVAGQQRAGYTFGTSVPWFIVCATFKAA